MFSMEERLHADWEVVNWFVSTSPQSVFTHSLMAARPVGQFRHALFNNDYSIHSPDAPPQRRTITDPDELAMILANDFGIALPEGVEDLLERLVQTSR